MSASAPPDTTPGAIRDTFGPLLCLDRRDVAGLTWTKTRARMWLNALKRRRKYALPAGATYTEQESELIGTLADLESAAGRLLEMADDDTT